MGILIPIYNGLEYTKKCLGCITKHIKENELKDIDMSVIVIDDGSTDGSSTWIKNNYPEVNVIYGDGNLWWSGAINLGAKYAFNNIKADYILLWNNDISPKADYFKQLCSILSEENEKTIIGSKIYNSSDYTTLWSVGGYFNPRTGQKYMIGYNRTDGEEYNKILEVDWLPGMGTLIPKNVVDSIGYWDNKNFPQYHGDSDFTYRAKLNGFKIKVYPQLKIWNDTRSTGIRHKGSYKLLIKSLYDYKSNFNIKKNFLFYKKYGKSYLAYIPLLKSYCRIFGGFIKWKIVGLFGRYKKNQL